MTKLFSKQLSSQQPLAAKIFETAIANNKLAKSYMLAGHANDDKWQLVSQLTAYLNCANINSKTDSSCLISETDMETGNWCTNCRWIQTDKHPQALIRLNGENSKSGKIGVEQARAFAEEVSKTSPYFRVMVIENAHQEILHRPAANALLKTIEEPRSKILMVFFAQVSNDVLPTIVSRCQTINIASNQYKECLSLSSPNTSDQLLLAKHSDTPQLKNLTASLEKFTSQGSKLTDAIDLTECIQSSIKEGFELDEILDFLITKDLLCLDNICASEREARYAKELFLLGQIAKEQSRHYVSDKALVETFIFAWHKLKQTGINPLKLQR